MTRKELDCLIDSLREGFDPPYKPEMKKGARFWNNERVINGLRTAWLNGKDLSEWNRMPTKEEFARDVSKEWVTENINKVFGLLCEADWHFTNREKWQ